MIFAATSANSASCSSLMPSTNRESYSWTLWCNFSVNALPSSVRLNITTRRSSRRRRREIRPMSTSLVTTRLMREAVTGRILASAVVVHSSCRRNDRRTAKSRGLRLCGLTCSAIPRYTAVTSAETLSPIVDSAASSPVGWISWASPRGGCSGFTISSSRSRGSTKSAANRCPIPAQSPVPNDTVRGRVS